MKKYWASIVILLVLVGCKNGTIKKEYYNDGKIKSEETYKDGKPNGYYITFYESGRIKDSSSIKDGQIDGIGRSYYENGKLNWQGEFKNGKAEGHYTKYYENGILRSEAFFKEGRPNGICREFTDNGQIRSRSEWKTDSTVIFDYYDAQGRDRKRVYFKNGVKTGYVDFDEDGVNLLPSHAIVFSKKDTISIGETYSASILFMEHDLNSLTNRHVIIAKLDSNDSAVGESRELPLVKNEYATYTVKPQELGKYDFSGYLEYTKANGHIVKAPFMWSFYVKQKK